VARRYYFDIFSSTADKRISRTSLQKNRIQGTNRMYALFYFFAWAAMWVWVVKTRGDWNLLLANLAGAASGFLVALAISIVCSGLFPSAVPPSSANMLRDLLEVMTTAGALAGVWMWMLRRPQPEQPLARHLLAGLCGMTAGITTLMFFVLNFR
jgi:hypothetical protein